MRQKFLFVISFCVALFAGSAWAEVEINGATFPDNSFRSWIASEKFDKDRDGKLSDEEIAAIKKLRSRITCFGKVNQ